MDYRAHVFAQNIAGYLKTCPLCDAYFSGDLSYCPDDGHLLFAVYCHDIRCFVGKFSGQNLSPMVESESTDHENVHYALISKASDISTVEFTMRGNISREGNFEADPSGSFHLAHLEAQNYAQLESDLIWMGDERRDYLYLYHLVKILLQSYGKSLGFVDNREMASRYSAILRDEFANDFLQAFLQLFYPHERQLDLSQTLDYLQKKIGGIDSSDLESSIFSEIALWYYRYISIPERMGGTKGLLKLRDSSYDWPTLSELHHELLAIFIRERALFTNYTDDAQDSRCIRFQRFWATSHYGIYIEDTLSTDPMYRGISLGEHGREYADFVLKWSAGFIQEAAHDLVNAGILTRQTTPDDKTVYYLLPEYICFDLPFSEYGEGDDGYEQLKKHLLFIAEVHSSDLRAAERMRIEDGLKRGDINFVVATPTLEMGIDIGDLESVLMVGAPPTPANYAQRAGRAGRGKKHEALIATFCWGKSAHDMYAFHNPKQIINGWVNPPAFNPQNPELIKKHVSAFVLRHHLTRDLLQRFALEADMLYMKQHPYMRRIFGEQFPYEQHLDELKRLIPEILSATANKSISLAHHCYMEGVFPDYGFRRDQVIAVDVQDKDRLGSEQTLDWNDYALTTRDLEQAFWFFVPDQTIFVAGDIYKTLNDGIYEELPDGARQYACFFAEKEIRFAQHRKEIKHLDTRRYFEPVLPDFVDKRGVLAVGYANQCLLSFRNHGIRRSQKETSTDEPQVFIGYDLQREAVVLRFDSFVCDHVLRNSLIASLIREINHAYGLATGEVRLMLDVRPPNAVDKQWIYAVLYDYDGNNNLPLRHIVDHFDALVSRAYQRLLACDCKTDGCYNCIKSYSMQYHAETLSKDRAEMFMGFLLGERCFEPIVLPYESPQPVFDLILNVRYQHNEIAVKRGTRLVSHQSVENDLNSAIFSTLTQAIYSEYQPDMSTLRIETWVKWLADTINQRSVNKGKDAFNRFQYALLRFKQVEAVVC